MSSNRLKFDNCQYKETIAQSTGPLEYMLNSHKYDNCNKCRMELGIVGGTAVSQITGNLVDLENDLRGQTRQNSLCSSQKYQNPCSSRENNCQPLKIPLGNDCGHSNLDTTKVHLPPCQMIRYRPVPLPAPLKLQGCPMNRPIQNIPEPYNI